MTKRVTAAMMVSGLLLAGCGGNKADQSANAAANAQASTSANTAAPAAPAAIEMVSAGERRVRIGIDGEHGMDACHTNGRISAQDSVPILNAPDVSAGSTDQVEPGLDVHVCETIPGWYGIVYHKGSQERDCGTGENLPGPQDYAGQCKSGWVPEQNLEVTAG